MIPVGLYMLSRDCKLLVAIGGKHDLGYETKRLVLIDLFFKLGVRCVLDSAPGEVYLSAR